MKNLCRDKLTEYKKDNTKKDLAISYTGELDFHLRLQHGKNLISNMPFARSPPFSVSLQFKPSLNDTRLTSHPVREA